MFKKAARKMPRSPKLAYCKVKVISAAENALAGGAAKAQADAEVVAEAATPLNATAPISKIFIDDLTERRKVWRVPWFIVIMCCVQLAVYAIANECIYQRLMFLPAHHNEYWRYLSYMLLHSDRVHLLLNVCLQCLIAFHLECEQGHWKVAAIYAAGGVSGSLITVAFQPQLALLGASAGVYALLMSHIPHLLKNFSQLPHRYLRIAALLILCLSDVAFSTFHLLVNRNTNPRICLEAHLAGGICGLCLGFVLYSRRGSGASERGSASTSATGSSSCVC